MPILLKPYRTIYYPIPKVACSSLKYMCANLLGLKVEDSVHKVNFPKTNPEFHYENYFTFAFVRNPWSRLVSCYRDKIRNEASGTDTYFDIREGVANCLAPFAEFKGGMTFDEFVKAVVNIPDDRANQHFKSQYLFITDKQRQVNVNFVGRFESITEDLREVWNKARFPKLDIPHLKKTPKADFRDFYNETTKCLVAERYEQDIKLFNYHFEV